MRGLGNYRANAYCLGGIKGFRPINYQPLAINKLSIFIWC